MTTQTIDEPRPEAFFGRFVQDLGAAPAACQGRGSMRGHAATVLVGDRPGLCRAVGDGRSVTAAEPAVPPGGDERHLAEWLAAQAASGHVDDGPAGGAFCLPPEQAFASTSGDNPVFVPGGLQVVAQDDPAQGYDLAARFGCLHDLGDPVGAAAHAGEVRIRQVAEQGGLTRFRRATRTSFNQVGEVRP